VDFSGDVALEAAEGFLLGLAFSQAAFHVQLGLFIDSKAGERDLVGRTVGVTITATVESVALLLA
jgi:hypothetical protein